MVDSVREEKKKNSWALTAILYFIQDEVMETTTQTRTLTVLETSSECTGWKAAAHQ